MANVGFLNIVVGASTGPLASGLRVAGKTVSGFASSVTGRLKGLGSSIVAPVLGAVGAGSMVLGFTKASSSIDSLAKSSQKLGVPTEQLGALRYAASLAGVGTEELDTGLGKMLKTIGEAQNGSTAATKALAEIGVAVADLQGMNAQQQFGFLSDKIAGITDPAQRAAAAMHLFGRGGMQLIPLMLQGSSGINAAANEAARLGILVKDIDASSVEGMNDAFSKVQFAVSGVFQKIAIELAPVLQTAFTDGAFAVGDLGKSIATFAADSVNELLFFFKTWDQQWKLIRLKSTVAMEDMLVMLKRIDSLGTWKPDPGPSKAQTELAVLMRDMTAQREQWEKIRSAKKNPLMDESSFFTGGGASSIAAVADDFVSITVGKAVRSLTPLLDESAFFAGDVAPTAATKLGASTQLAAAAQIGTTEGASQLFAAISGRRSKDDQIAVNTEKTAVNTDRLVTAVQNLEMPDLNVVDDLS